MPTRIERTLAYQDSNQDRKVVAQDEITSFSGPVVILGDPGMGKTELTRELGLQPGMTYVRAGKFARSANPRSLIAGSDRVIVDGLDEIASAAPGSAVEAVLTQLSAIGHPSFVLSCREADWLGAADRARIEEDYGVAAVLLHLRPFTREDAHAFLSGKIPGIDADGLLDSLEQRGLEGLYGNPLTLGMLGEVATVTGALPETRARLFEAACYVMLTEFSDPHDADPHAHLGQDELLLAAGAICAAQVLCGVGGVHTGSRRNAPEDCLRLVDIATLPFGEYASLAVKTRLFRAEGENRFTHVHRVVAEYLGAYWLVRCFENGVSEKRVFALLRQGEGVPTSLRGLHAWMAHFSESLSRRSINADPYAVLRYGDAETLSLNQARALLAALKKLSGEDPYFWSEDWGRHPARGLMRPELRDDILGIIQPRGSHTQLSVFLLESMTGSDVVHELAPNLEAIVFDPDRCFAERLHASGALHSAEGRDDREAFIRRLLELEDADSARLAWDLLDGIGAVSVPIAIDTVLTHLGLAANRDSASESHELRDVPDELLLGFDTGQLAELLDGLCERARPSMETADSSVRSTLADILRSLTIRVLKTDPAIEPQRVWAWIGWLQVCDGYDDDAARRLARIVREDRALRTALLGHVLLGSGAADTWTAGRELLMTLPDLYPSPEELAALLKELQPTAGALRADAATFRDLLQLGRYHGALPIVLRTAAAEVAAGDPELLSVLADLSAAVEPVWRTRQAQRAAALSSELQRTLESYRDALARRERSIAAGDAAVLAQSAEVYLGLCRRLDGHYPFDSEASPEERLRFFLGDELSDRVQSGFIAALTRDDLPSASGIAEIHCENRQYPAESAMICAAIEMLRKGQTLCGIERETLAATYMAWQRLPRSLRRLRTDVGAALEPILFVREADWEAHFRTSIEPQLSCNREHVVEFGRLAHEPALAGLAGRLAINWLRAYPALSAATQKQLLACALKSAPRDALRALLVGRRAAIRPDQEADPLWLSMEFAVEFEDRREALRSAVGDNPDLIWAVRDRIGPPHDWRFARYSLDHLVFIVEAFGTHWPMTDLSHGPIMGTCEPGDASAFIRSTIHAIASRPSPQATQALHHLLTDHAPSYADTTRHALALQRRIRRDAEYAAPTIAELRSVMANALPETTDDMRAWFADRLEQLQERIRASDTDTWQAYWKDAGKPQDENYCRNRLIEHISLHLPESIRLGRETSMPRDKRADIALTRNTIKLPIEIKGQWSSELWSAAIDQLDTKYAVDWQAEGRGVYVVLWFGDVPDRSLRRHPDGLERPRSPHDLQRMLIDRLPEVRRAWIDVFVLDVSRPSGTARV